MIPQKFTQNLKCDCFQPENYCSCPNKIIGSYTLIESVNDAAAAIVEVMKLCGINLVKAKAAHNVIIYYLLHFEEIRHRIDSIPRKRLTKEGLINELTCKCNMNRMETQMTFSIIKRVFKAFYYGSDEGGVPNPLLSTKLAHSPECLWVHAAQRTAQVYAAYEGIFYACQKDFECKIKLIYKQLYDRIESRRLSDASECICMKCFKKITAETLRPVKSMAQLLGHEDQYEALYTKELDDTISMNAASIDEEETDASDVKDSKDDLQEVAEEYQCTCPSLKLSDIDYAYQAVAESVKSDCSQGPFNCRWLSINKEEYEADDVEPDIKLSQEETCPPCYSLDSECEPEYQSSCEECKCQTDDNYFCSENNLEQEEMNDEELDYDDYIDESSSMIAQEIQNIAARTIIMSAKCSATPPKRSLSKCSKRNENIFKQMENEDRSLQETSAGSSQHQQLDENSDIPTIEI